MTCPSFSGLPKATPSQLGSSGRETGLGVPMSSPIPRPNMFEALCSWAWSPAVSELTTEGATHSTQASVCTGFYHLFCLSPTWYTASSLFRAGEVRLRPLAGSQRSDPSDDSQCLLGPLCPMLPPSASSPHSRLSCSYFRQGPNRPGGSPFSAL